MSKPSTNGLPDLPTGPSPNWELQPGENQEEEEVKQSVFDSHVILQSLRRSRERWLYSNFPRFSTKTRTGKAVVTPPPHTIQTRGKCDLEIGPHIFPGTVFYEVHYLLPNTSTPAYRTQQPNVGGSSWQSATRYNGSYTPYVREPVQNPQGQTSGSSSAATSQAASNPPNSSAPLISSLDTVTTITPALINQVNAAASSNPTLANLLQLAAAGKASPDQLKTLGLLIQSLATPENTHALPLSVTDPPSQTHMPTSAPPAPPQISTSYATKDFDLVIEFTESPSERWVFPRGLATCEKILDNPSVDATCHTIIKTLFPFGSPSVPSGAQEATSTSDVSTKSSPSHVVSFHLRKAPLAVWDTIYRWVGDECKMHENRKLLESVVIPDRKFLAHHLDTGFLLNQLQMASLNPHLKLLKPGTQGAPRTKRKVITAPFNEEVAGDPTIPQPTGQKRRRISKVLKKSGTGTPILCLSCGQADVPLIFGGRFCRPCVDNGKVIPSYSHAPNIPTTATLPTQTSNSKSVSLEQVQTPGVIHSSLSTLPIAPDNESYIRQPTESSLV